MLNALRDFRTRDGYQRWVARTETPLLVLALLFVVFLVLPVLVPLRAEQQVALFWANATLWAVFTVDYLVRL